MLPEHAPSPASPTAPRAAGSPVAWSIYLATSWTWCIGMFLPVLLIRDLGLLSWLVFAIPNVLGAAAMGWVLSRRGSVDLVTHPAHAHATKLFSAVTGAFNLFFLLWLVTGPGANLVPVAMTAAAVTAVLVMLSPKHPLFAAAAVWLCSIAMGIWLVVLAGFHLPSLAPVGSTENEPPIRELLALAPVCILGFLLCPYLDLTFHRARQAVSQSAGSLTFTLGFGFFFLSMIVLTPLYAHLFLSSKWTMDPGPLQAAAAVPLVIHLASQLIFTVLVHHIELMPTGPSSPRRAVIWAWGPWELLLVALAIGAFLLARLIPDYAGLAGPELLYRAFMSFYGLIFPIYVLFCVIPMSPRSSFGALCDTSPRVGAKLLAAGVTALLATPAYWMGFIERQYEALPLGVLIILAGWAITRWRMRKLPI